MKINSKTYKPPFKCKHKSQFQSTLTTLPSTISESASANSIYHTACFNVYSRNRKHPVCLSVVWRPAPEYFARMETSPLTVKGRKSMAYDQHLHLKWPLSREHLQEELYNCAKTAVTKPSFSVRSHSKDRPNFVVSRSRIQEFMLEGVPCIGNKGVGGPRLGPQRVQGSALLGPWLAKYPWSS